MRPLTWCLLGVLLALLTGFAEARERSVIREFRRLHPCPSTGKTTGPCPGWRADHPVPLCAGGPDTIANLQWQEVRESFRKDVDERRLCRWLRKKP